MAQFNDVLEECVRELEPHRMVFFLLDLAGEFHRYYNRTRILSEDRELTSARMLLAQMVQLTVRRGLTLLGINAPTKMIARADLER
jgi:arginyl-tRNA synthetase